MATVNEKDEPATALLALMMSFAKTSSTTPMSHSLPLGRGTPRWPVPGAIEPMSMPDPGA